MEKLTPEIIRDYLDFKSKEEADTAQKDKLNAKVTVAKQAKNFLIFRKELVPHYVSAEEFCNMINSLRKKIWEYSEAERLAQAKKLAQENTTEKNNINQEGNNKKVVSQKKEKFENALNETIIFKMIKRGANIGHVKSLVGTLLHVFKNSKYQEYLNQSEAEITDNFVTNPKEDQFEIIFESLKEMYFFDQEIGNQTSNSENGEFFDQAWRVFETEEIKSMPEEERKKLYAHLYKKYSK